MRQKERFLEAATLTAILLLAAFLRLWNLSANGFSNVYYAAAARSGLESWRNAFFASYDPAGFVSVDKPPVALWIQTLSAALFGYSGLALHVPQAVAGILAVFALWRIVRRGFGRAGGLAAALALAISPVSVAVDRSNLPDAWLALFLILSAGAFLQASETGRLAPLLVGGALAGLAFNIKMLAAFVPLPAFFAAYLIGKASYGPPSPPLMGGRGAIARILLALAVLITVSASWATIVDLTPPASRPYVGGSRDNSAFGLIFGYNGAARLTGGAGQFGTGATGMNPANAPPGLIAGGDPSPFRLFRPVSAEQALWLFPLALCGLFLATGQTADSGQRTAGENQESRIKNQEESIQNPKSKIQNPQYLLWGGWAGLYFAVLSASRGTYHPYYLSALTPALAALVGMAVAVGRRGFREGKRLSVAAVTASVVVTAWWQGSLLRPNGDPATPLIAGLIVGAVVAVGAALLALLVSPAPPFAGVAFVFGASVLCVAPLLWSVGAGETRNSGLFPAAHPPAFLQPKDADASIATWREPTEETDARTLRYLLTHQGNARYLCVTPTVRFASPLIIQTGKPVLPLGGFLGTDPILTTDRLRAKIRSGEVRYFLDTGEYGLPGGEQNDKTQQSLRAACRPVPPADWLTPGSPLGGLTLYDCR